MSTRVLLVAVLLLGACTSRSEIEDLQTLLDECRADKLSAQNASSACEQRYEDDVRRWEDLDEIVSSVLPQTLGEFRQERQRIVEMIPNETRQEVEGYLDALSDSLGRGFQVLKEENAGIALELEVAQSKLDLLGARTRAIDAQTSTIGEQTSSISESLDTTLRESLKAQRDSRQRLQSLVHRIHEFDRDFISERSSPDRLRLNRRQREAIAAFHASLVEGLSAASAER